MRIVLLQTDIVWAEPQENIRRVERLMAEATTEEEAGDTLFVLPEMWATGFCVEPEGIAEDEERSVALAWMKETTRKRGCALSGSLAVRTSGGSYRNRHYFVTPDKTVYYDKHHLFRHGGEDAFFTAGTEAVIAEWKGLRILLQTCYDLRFPVFSRYGLAGEYDAIIYVANWPAKRQLAWDTLIRARAIENQCCVAAVNRVGSDAVCDYGGESAIIDPIGRTMAACPEGLSWTITHLDASDIAKARSRFRVLADKDSVRMERDQVSL